MKLKFKIINRRYASGYPVRLYININGTRIEMNTGVFLQNPQNFDSLSLVHNDEPNNKVKNIKLRHIQSEIEMFMLTEDNPILIKERIETLVDGNARKREIKKLYGFIMDFAATKDNSGTRGLYELTARKVSDFDNKADFENVTAEWLKNFERYNIGNGMTANGIAIHLRNIRTVFNWCIDNEYTDKYPFRKFKIKSEKVPIRNLTAEQMALLHDYEVEPWQEIYRDFFMLSFYLCGINPVDLLHLKSENIINGRLTYKRRKTGHLFNLPVPQEAQDIISKYSGTNWLLSPLDKYSDYKDFLHHWNGALKKIGTKEIVPDKVGKRRKVVYHPLFPTLTVYSARYSFASIGAELDIPRETIALCLGHSWADVTSHYIAYDTKKIDKAVRQIIDYVNSMVNHQPNNIK